MAVKKKSEKKGDRAIVIPVRRLKTKSGRDASKVIAEGENAIAELADEITELQAKDESVGRDLRIVDGKVLIKFPKFVNMIVMHDFENVMEKHADDDIVIPSELLVDLANAHDDEEASMPWGYLLAGVLVGVIVAIVVTQLV